MENTEHFLYCQKCGSKLPVDSNFCGSCGFEVTPEWKRAEELKRTLVSMKKQEEMESTFHSVEDGINIFYPDGHDDLGKIFISPTEIVIYKKSMAIRICFGLLASIFDKGKETLRLNISDIVVGEKKRFRLNKNAYHITMKDGATYVLCFDKPKTTIPYLNDLINAYKK